MFTLCTNEKLCYHRRTAKHDVWKSCQLQHNSVGKTCTVSPEQIEVIGLEGYSRPTYDKLQRYGHVLRKDDDWVKKCMEYEVEETRRKTKEDLETGCGKKTVKHVNWTRRMLQIDRSRWRKLIKDVWWTGWVWVGECFFWYWPTRVVPDKGPLNGCVCACVSCIVFETVMYVNKTNTSCMTS